MSEMPTGLLVMAYGTASGPGDIERYYTEIRGGRPPSPEHLEELVGRYAAIGNRFPLLDITRGQAEGLAEVLSAQGEGEFRGYLGMKHSPPFIAEGVARMREDGIRRAVGIVMAPHWSGMSVQTYIDRVRAAVKEEPAGSAATGAPTFSFIESYHDHPAFVDFLASRVRAALAKLSESQRADAAVVFSAHSLPTRPLEDGSMRCKYCTACEPSCRYRDGLAETAELVSDKLGLGGHRIAWQSAGRTDDPWWGPPVGDVIRAQAAAGRSALVVCSAGFVADHLEILYDLDIEAQEIADEAGIPFVRTEMPNADPSYLRVLTRVVRDHLAEHEPARA